MKRWDAAGIRRLSLVVNGYYFAVLALAVVGLRHFRPRHGHGAVLLPTMVVWLTLVHAVFFFGGNRFHFPLLPIFAVMAASAIGPRRDAAIG